MLEVQHLFRNFRGIPAVEDVSFRIAPGEIVRVRITNAQRATLEGELENGNITFENFR